MKVFVSYSRRDAGDFAESIQKNLTSFNYNVFTDVNSISVGDIWSNTIEENISNCDVFIVIVTYGALQSPHVQNEFLQAQREKKRIIPCLHRNVREGDIKWGLNNIQGVEFTDKYELARDLYTKIAKIQRETNKGTSGVIRSSLNPETKVASKYNQVQESKTEIYSNDTLPTEYKNDYTNTRGKKKNQILNFKIVMPIVGVVAVIGVILAFILSSPTPAPDPSTPALDPTPIDNTPPVPNNQSVTTNLNEPRDIRLTASDPERTDNLTAYIVSKPLHGVVGDINQNTGNITYTPNPGFTGSDKFTFKANDGKVDSNKIGRVEIITNQPSGNINHPPTPNNQSVVTSMNKAIDTKLTASDPDSNDNLTAALVSKPLHGTISDINQDTGIVTYTPNPDFVGNDQFTFKVNDGKGDSNNVGRISITVNNAQN
jgi:hypothetical protein